MNNSSKVVNKSFLKWAGGKRKLLDKLLNEIGEVGGTYIEPFLGSGVVAFNVTAKDYILADTNKDLINVYEQLKTHGEVFIESCEDYFSPSIFNKEFYYIIRDNFNNCGDDFLKAIQFIYLNRNCFNGLCRYNSKGKFNVPVGKYKTIYFPKKEMLEFHERSSKYKLLTESFENVIIKAEKNDTVYCDPPYVPLSDTSYFTAYGKDGFGVEQQKLLAKLAEKSKCKVIISNHDTEFTRALYKNAKKIVELEVTRSIAAKGTSRKKVKELLAIYED